MVPEQFPAPSSHAPCETKRDGCPPIVLISSDHGDADEARWMINSLRSYMSRSPERRYRIWNESVVPDGMISDMHSFGSAVHCGDLGVEALTLNWPLEFQRTELRTEIRELFRPLYQAACITSQLNDPNFILALPALPDGAFCEKRSANDFPEFDREFVRGLLALRDDGFKMRLDVELAPFEACVHTLHAGAQGTLANVMLSAGEGNEAVRLIAGFNLLTQRAKDLRDRALVELVRAAAAANPDEVQIIPRGSTHERGMRGLLPGLEVSVNPSGTGCYHELEEPILRIDFEEHFALGCIDPQAREAVSRQLFDIWMRNTFMHVFGWTTGEAYQHMPEVATAMDGTLLRRWLDEVIEGRQRSGPLETLLVTLHWLSELDEAAPLAAERAKRAQQLLQKKLTE